MVYWATMSLNWAECSYLIPREITELLYFAQAQFKSILQIHLFIIHVFTILFIPYRYQ